MVYMYHNFLIHSSADGHLGCFHVLAAVNRVGHMLNSHEWWFPWWPCSITVYVLGWVEVDWRRHDEANSI